MNFISLPISQQSLTGAGVLVAGIIKDQVIGTTSDPTVWNKYAGGFPLQVLNLIDQLNAVNSGSGVDWSFLAEATLLDLEWNLSWTFAAGETSIQAASGVPQAGAKSLNTAEVAYDQVLGSQAPLTLPLTTPVSGNLSGRTIAPVETGEVNLTAGLLYLDPAQSAFSSTSSRFSVTCRVFGWQA